MKKRLISLILCIAFFAGATPLATSATDLSSVIEDEALLAALIDEGCDTNGDLLISADELSEIFLLDISGRGVVSLEGMQYASSLMILSAENNAISDITPLTALPMLSVLNLSNNALKGELPDCVSGMTSLENADFSRNAITGIAPLGSLAGLTYLDVSSNSLSDSSELSALSAVETLCVQYNRFSLDPNGGDYSVFTALSEREALRSFTYAPQLIDGVDSDVNVNLEAGLKSALIANGVDINGDSEISVCEVGCFYGELDLSSCSAKNISILRFAVNASGINLSSNSAITDYSPIAGLTALKSLSLSGNGITSLDMLKNLTSLQKLDISLNNITDISQIASLTSLKELKLSENFIASVNGCLPSVRFTKLDLSNNCLTDVSELYGISAVSLDISRNNLTNIVPSAFSNVTNLISEPQTEYEGNYRDEAYIPDEALLAALIAHTGINKNSDSVITKGELYDYSGSLTIFDLSVSDLTGLQYMKNLSVLRFDNTRVTDLTPVAGMSSLQVISGAGTGVSDLSPLMQLSKLQTVNLDSARISSLAPFADSNLPSLISLYLPGNRISDASALSNTPTLVYLTLSDNSISDISFVSSLPALSVLDLGGNRITDASALLALRNLTSLNIASNYIELESGFEAQLKANNPNLSTVVLDNQSVEKTVAYIYRGLPYGSTLTVQKGSAVTLDSVSDSDFLCWEDLNGNRYSAGSSVSIYSDTLLTAVFKSSHSISVVSGDGGNVKISVNSVTDGQGYSSKVITAQTGDKITLTATSDIMSVFVCWMSLNGTVLSYDRVYSFTASGDDYVFAQFRRPYSGGFYVSFMSDELHQISKTGYKSSAAPESIVIPDLVPEKYGFTFIGWSVDGITALSESELRRAIVSGLKNGDVTVTPVYQRNEVFFTLSVNEGAGSGSFAAGAKATVTANTPESGKKFSHWINANGETVSYSAQYSFIITGDTQLTAIYESESAQAVSAPVIRIVSTAYDESAGTVSFIAERDIPAQYTLIKTGIILTNNRSIAEDENAFVIDGNGVLKGSSSSLQPTASYMLTKTNVEPGDTWYARGYAVCIDEDGNTLFVLSDVAF